MSTLADRLRGVLGTPPAARPPGADAAGREAEMARPQAPPACAATLLGGQWRDDGPSRFLAVDRVYRPDHRHGRVTVADAAPPPQGWRRWPLLGGAAAAPRLLFLDLETTGLAGGAGTYAFLVGCGWFEPSRPGAAEGDAPAFRVRQFFLSSYGAEKALLLAVGALAGDTTTVVTFNGKTFDLPVMETRFVIHRLATPFAGLPHVDMLHPSRRLWRDGDSDCRLGTLERHLCGYVRQGDVPGFEIPARYFTYVRTGDARPLEAVLEHNRLDLLSLALLTGRAARLLDEGHAGAGTVREALGIGKFYEAAGMLEAAHAAYERAVGLRAPDVATRADALRALAGSCRRYRRHAEAADLWRAILSLGNCPSGVAREASEALAVHHEHRLRDPWSARDFALQSLQLHESRARRTALEHRLDRLSRKLGARAPAGSPLF